MNIIESMKNLRINSGDAGTDNIFSSLTEELNKSLALFWEKSGGILSGSGVELLAPPAGYYDLENNFFSALFLYSYYRAGIASERRILYSAMNQCLRGMVTGCDNILDDEYKRTLETSLPEKGIKFRSVLDIMVSDRVLFELSAGAFQDMDKILSAGVISLHSLIKSGYQEATEEGGVNEVLSPDYVIEKIHHYKTGILFNCPWAIPSVIEKTDDTKKETMNRALYNIGIGCQIMDDMADIERDIKTRHHNYAASLIYHNKGAEKFKELKELVLSISESGECKDFFAEFNSEKNTAVEKAREYLTNGFSSLFEDSHRFLVEPAIKFLAMRIGVERYF